MSIWRGAQSAIFFYLSCAPCSDARYRKARARAAAHTHAERAVTKSRHPDYPDQALPGGVNPFWQAEIEAGPKISKKEWKDAKERKEREAQRGKSEKWFLVGGRRVTEEGEEDGSTEVLEGRDGEADRGKREQRLKRTHSAYQRADEELWGTTNSSSTTNPPPSYRSDSHLASTSTIQLPSRPTTARTTTSHPHTYHPDRNPAINDLHPPTTRKITTKDEVAWMLQPLPVAAVMRGQEPPNPSVITTPVPNNSSPAYLHHANLAAARSHEGSSAGSRRSPTDLLPVKPARQAAANYSGETAIGTPESGDVDSDADDEEVPERWVYEQTRREVQARRSLEW